MRYLPFLLLLVFAGCEDEDCCVGPEPEGIDISSYDYSPESYELVVPESYREFTIPAGNPLTQAGVELGRHLFYDKRLSSDSTMSCASCHLSQLSFTDAAPVSTGVEGNQTLRSSMPLIDLVYATNGLFWDGRAQSLEEQAVLPVEDPVELFENWDNVLAKLRRDELYHRLFREAFGINNTAEISRDLATKAIAQFERTMVSSGTSLYDQVVADQGVFFNDSQQNGFDLFFDLPNDLPDAECGHCHAIPTFTTHEYMNNGIDSVETLSDFVDKGFGETTGQFIDNGKFRVPTLRNIELTAPYMHDGRFATLEEVIDHYNSGGHYAINLDSNIRPLGLSEQNKADLIAFLKTLTDTAFVNDPRFQNPFQ